MEEQAVFGYEFEGTRYDAGTTMGWLKASVELALARPDLGDRVPGLPPGRSSSEPADRRPCGTMPRTTRRPRGRATQHEGTTWRRSDRSSAAATG